MTSYGGFLGWGAHPLESNVRVNLPERDTGRSRDKAACDAQTGWPSGREPLPKDFPWWGMGQGEVSQPEPRCRILAE